MKGHLLQGSCIWPLAALAAWLLPGHLRHPSHLTSPSWEALLTSLGAFLLLGLGAPMLTRWLGPYTSQRWALTLWESQPTMVWGGLGLALWPAVWGPPGRTAWVLLVLASGLPSELRWLSQTIPAEHPFPAAWGRKVLGRQRTLTLLRVLPRWIAARLPVWLTATVVLERMLGVSALGSDWINRVALRDKPGMSLWILALALFWWFSQQALQPKQRLAFESDHLAANRTP